MKATIFMITSVLISVGAFFLFLLLLAVEDYRNYEIQRRLNRESLRREYVKYGIFSSLGKLYSSVENNLKEANVNIDADSFILGFLYFAIAVVTFSLYAGKLLYGILTVIVSYIGIRAYLSSAKLNVKHKMEKQFGAFIEDVAINLKTTPDLYTAIKSTLKYTQNPLKDFMEKVVSDVEYGKSIDDALVELKRHTDSSIINDWIDSIIFARAAKSNLAPVCNHTAQRINDKLVRSIKIKAITSKTKGTIFMIMLIIIGSAVMTISSSPDFKQAYSTTAGQIVLLVIFSIIVGTTYFIFKSIDRMVKS